MRKRSIVSGIALATTLAGNAFGVTSAEIFTTDAYQYGRFSARIQFAPGSGVVSSFFLWKDGSEVEGTFWNELDFEKLEAECRVETNTIYGNPVGLHSERHELGGDLCASYHVYTYEWTPEYLSWTVDGVEIRRETGDVVQAYAQNTAAGMQLRFNVWPGDETFGGVFSPSILPVYQYIDWIEFSSYSNGEFELLWRDDFTDANLPARWSTASWDSPKGLSTHAASNVAVLDGYVVLALTSDEATGTTGASPRATDTDPDPTGTMPDSSASTNDQESMTSADAESSSQPATTSDLASDASSSQGSEPSDSTGETTDSTSNNSQEQVESGAATSTPASSTPAQPTSAAATATRPETSASTTVGDSTSRTMSAPTAESGDSSSANAGSSASGCGCKVGRQPGANHPLLLSALGLLATLGFRTHRRVRSRQRAN